MSLVLPPPPVVTKIEHLLQLMSTRMSWNLGAKILERANIHVSRGWGETIASVRSRPPVGDALAHAEKTLENAFNWHTFVGNKQVTWYDFNELDPEWKKSILDWAENCDAAFLNNTYGNPRLLISEAPYLEEHLAPLLSSEPQLISIARSEGKLYFQYFSVRSYTIRESINFSEWPDEQRARIGEFYEVIGVKLKSIPCFDTFVIDISASRLEVRVDFAPGLRANAKAGGVYDLLGLFNELVMKQLAIKPAGLGLVNFFPAVSGIYADKTAGRVNMLGFVAISKNTSSNNKGQILKRQDQDLRSDEFHLGGSGAVDKINPYTVGATWPSPSGLEPLTVELHGGVKMIYGTGIKQISMASFLGCTDGKDFDFLTSELKRQLST